MNRPEWWNRLRVYYGFGPAKGFYRAGEIDLKRLKHVIEKTQRAEPSTINPWTHRDG